MDAANVDLKSFRDDFYRQLCGARLAPVLETLEYIRNETDCWLEVTTLLIPGLNDSEAEIDELTAWVAEHLGEGTPLHFSAFHPGGRDAGVARHAAWRRCGARGRGPSRTACSTSMLGMSAARRRRPRPGVRNAARS